MSFMNVNLLLIAEYNEPFVKGGGETKRELLYICIFPAAFIILSECIDAPVKEYIAYIIPSAQAGKI